MYLNMDDDRFHHVHVGLMMGRLSAPESGWKFEGSISPSTSLENLEEVLYKADKVTVTEETRVFSCRHKQLTAR